MKTRTVKHAIATVTALFCAVTTMPANVKAATSPRWGDVNGDGEISVEDAQGILTYYVTAVLAETKWEDANFDIAVADVDCAEGITVEDAQLVLQKYVVEGLTNGSYMLPAETAQQNSDDYRVLCTNADGWYVWSEPNNSVGSRIVDICREGELFEVLQKDGDWYKVKLMSGKTGYMNISEAEFDNYFVVYTRATEPTSATTTTSVAQTTTSVAQTTTSAAQTTTTAAQTTTSVAQTTTTAAQTTTTVVQTTTTSAETTAEKPFETFEKGDTIQFELTAWKVYVDANLSGVMAWVPNGTIFTIIEVYKYDVDGNENQQVYLVEFEKDGAVQKGYILNGREGYFKKVDLEVPSYLEVFEVGDQIEFTKTAYKVYNSDHTTIRGWVQTGTVFTIKEVIELPGDDERPASIVYYVEYKVDENNRLGWIYAAPKGYFKKIG